MVLDNQNPTVYAHQTPRERIVTPQELDENVTDPFDAREIFDMIRFLLIIQYKKAVSKI